MSAGPTKQRGHEGLWVEALFCLDFFFGSFLLDQAKRNELPVKRRSENLEKMSSGF